MSQDEDHKKLYRKRTLEEIEAIIAETNRLAAALDAEELASPMPSAKPAQSRRANPERDARQAAIVDLVGMGHSRITNLVKLQRYLAVYKPPFKVSRPTLTRDLADLRIHFGRDGIEPM